MFSRIPIRLAYPLLFHTNVIVSTCFFTRFNLHGKKFNDGSQPPLCKCKMVEKNAVVAAFKWNQAKALQA